MAQWRQRCLTVGLLAACLVAGQAGPGFSRPGEADVPLVLAAGPTKHVIKSGETLNLLAARYGVPTAAILKANPGLSPTKLQLGKEILIPASGAPAVSGKPPLPGIETLPSGPPESAPIKPIELRPEKAPQATPPLVARDLVDPQARPAPAQPAASAAPAAPTAEPDRAQETGAPRQAPPQAAAAGPAADTGRPATSGAAPAGGFGALVAMPLTWAVLVVAALLGLLWALRGVLDNLAAGVTLRLLRLPRQGDVVRLDGCLGRVESLGWRVATVRTVDDERLLVPNARMLREAIVVLPPAATGR